MPTRIRGWFSPCARRRAVSSASGRGCAHAPRGAREVASGRRRRLGVPAAEVESPGGIAPPGAHRSRREPLDSPGPEAAVTPATTAILVIQPCGLGPLAGSSHQRWLTAETARMTRPLRSTRITGLHSYYEAVRPCAPHRYSAPRGFCRLGFSLPRTAAGQCCATGRPRAWDDRFTRSAPKPRPSSRHLHAGHRLANRQAPARLIPGEARTPGFDVIFEVTFDTSSVVRSRSPSWSTPAALTARLFPQRSPPRLLTAAARGGLRPPLQGGRGGPPAPQGQSLHLRCSTASDQPDLLHRASLLRFVFTPSPFPMATARDRAMLGTT
jgi:hypothetical protein